MTSAPTDRRVPQPRHNLPLLPPDDLAQVMHTLGYSLRSSGRTARPLRLAVT